MSYECRINLELKEQNKKLKDKVNRLEEALFNKPQMKPMLWGKDLEYWYDLDDKYCKLASERDKLIDVIGPRIGFTKIVNGDLIYIDSSNCLADIFKELIKEKEKYQDVYDKVMELKELVLEVK